MGTLFRSQEMTLCQLFLQTEAAYACVSELGELGLVQFRDLNPDVNAFQRKFVNEIRRCDEMERKLRFLEKEIKKDNIPMLDTGENPEAPAPREMIDLEATYEKLENDLKEVNANAEQLKRNYLELTELKHILRKTQNFFDEAEREHLHWQAAHEAVSEDRVGLLGEEGLRAGGQGMRLGFVAGVILRERLPGFERMLWRACRGNVFLKQAEIETPLDDPSTGDNVYKSVFIIFYQGDQLKSRVKKICEGFRATLYPCPDSQSERREMAIGVMTRIEDLNTVLNQTQDHRHRVLVTAAQNIKIWGLKVRKIKAIYHTLNMFNLDVTNKCLIGECWCAVDDLDKIHLALRRGTERSGSSVQPILNRMRSHEDPPTYHRTNKLTVAFQSIVDAYGVARYREINPAPFTVITFPFLFAVMFGDAGHGLIMLLFALWMVVREKQLKQTKGDNEIWNTFFGGRYIILLMGAFSVYTGLIYNDIYSKSFNIFGSGWYPAYSYNGTVVKSKMLQLDPNKTQFYSGNPYPFGIDPVWQVAENKITFTNSIKMKMSVILGVFQMLFGVSLSVLNHNFYNDRLAIFFEFIPQVIFMSCIFGYLVILIFVKWVKFTAANASCAPSLLIGLINMFMFKYAPIGECSNLVYAGQPGLQSFFVVLAILCVPVMLVVKPYMLYRRHKARSDGYRQLPTYHSKENGNNVLVVDVEASVDSTSHSGGLHELEEDEAEELNADQLSVQSGDIRQRDGGESGGVAANGNATPTSNSTAGLVPGSEEAGAVATPAEFNLSDICVTQSIHTIEYCLGCISNTASYLRLWALSLAHAQLSEVLWNMVFKLGLSAGGYGGSIMIFFIFAFWAVLTICVLLIMEGLSAFLHALRLHWIEFQNKFYQGTGYLFQPFSFEQLVHLSSEE